jgi:hypothetical protein
MKTKLLLVGFSAGSYVIQRLDRLLLSAAVQRSVERRLTKR